MHWIREESLVFLTERFTDLFTEGERRSSQSWLSDSLIRNHSQISIRTEMIHWFTDTLGWRGDHHSQDWMIHWFRNRATEWERSERLKFLRGNFSDHIFTCVTLIYDVYGEVLGWMHASKERSVQPLQVGTPMWVIFKWYLAGKNGPEVPEVHMYCIIKNLQSGWFVVDRTRVSAAHGFKSESSAVTLLS